MTAYEVQKIEFNLDDRITIQIRRSQIVVQFKFEKHAFKDYLAAKINTLPLEDRKYPIVDVTEHNIPMPDGLLRALVEALEEFAAVCAGPEDDAPISKLN